MYCKKCGSPIDKDSKYCPACGTENKRFEKKGIFVLFAILGAGVIVGAIAFGHREKEDAALELAEEYEVESEKEERQEPEEVVSDEQKDWTVSDVMQQYQEQIASYIQSGNFGEAEECYLECKTSYPQEEKVYLYAADIYLAQDDYDKAIEILQEGAEVVDAASLTERIEYVAEHVKLCKTEREEDGSISYWEEWEYDTFGNEIKNITHVADGSIGRWLEWEYDASGNMIKYISYNADGSIGYWEEYEYDASGNKIKYIGYNADESISWWEEHEYDTSGNEIKYIKYNADGSVWIWEEYEYDAFGNEIKCTRYNADGSISSWTEYEYDIAGNAIKHTWYDADGSISSWSESEYDEFGNEIKDMAYEYHDGSFNSWESEYEYDTSGNMIKEISYYMGHIRDFFEYEYDAFGNVIKSYEERANRFSNFYEYEYDDRGNLIKKKVYDNEGDMVAVIENRGEGERIKASSPRWQYEYRYDSLGNTIWEFCKEFADVGNVEYESTTTYTYTYTGTLLCQDSEKAGE